jgi:anti-sigma regulatory factor (Ser/Thr protein kinase)
VTEAPSPVETYSHEAYFYADGDEYLSRALPFVEAGIDGGEAVLLALPEGKRELMRQVLGDRGEQVHFMAMEEIGRNPARLISFWRDFLREDGRLATGARGLGESVYPGRSAAEIEEGERHERLVDLAFGGLDRLTFLCPYDAANLSDEVLQAAESAHSHGHDHPAGGEVLGGMLPPPGPAAATLHFRVADLREVRRLASEQADEAGFGEQRTADLALALSEVATNSVIHGGGEGELAIWSEDDALVCEIRDAGTIEDPLVGRQRPASSQIGGRGLWIANQLCDLLQIRSGARGTQVRLRMEIDD